ncbi:MAG: hypothetical protein R2825_08930 [Saprospiraceae bacterium]
MNAANFHEYLKNPSMLHQVNYQELKSLSLQYPYAANLRYLMLVKSLMDNKREYDRNLVLASLSSVDRKKLHQLVMRYSLVTENADNYEIVEEFLELKDLSTLEEVLESGTAASESLRQQAVPLDTNSGLEFLNDLDEIDTDDRVADSLEEVGPIAEPPVLEELLEEDVTEKTPVGESTTEDSFLVQEATPEPEEESIDQREINDLEDLEIEESLDGLFEGAAQEPKPADQIEEAVLDTIDGFPEIEKEADLDEINTDEEGNSPIEETLEELGATPSPAKGVPLEITNDDPFTENSIEDLDAQPTPSPKSAFASYQKVQPHKSGLLGVDLEDLKMEIKGATPPVTKAIPTIEDYKEPEDVAKKVAASSLSEDNSIATETLAGILERQGHFDKAIKMYEKLSLQFPEKSSTFAAKIEKLRKK